MPSAKRFGSSFILVISHPFSSEFEKFHLEHFSTLSRECIFGIPLFCFSLTLFSSVFSAVIFSSFLFHFRSPQEVPKGFFLLFEQCFLLYLLGRKKENKRVTAELARWSLRAFWSSSSSLFSHFESFLFRLSILRQLDSVGRVEALMCRLKRSDNVSN